MMGGSGRTCSRQADFLADEIKKTLIVLVPRHPNANRERDLVSASCPSAVWHREDSVPPAQEGSPQPQHCSWGRSCLLLSSEETVPLLLGVMGAPRRQGN